MNECVFCKIINREIPANIIYENGKVLAFLDINPINRGHTLIVPKKHYGDVYDITEDHLRETVAVAKKISEAVKRGLGAEGVNILHASGEAAQQSVFHFHIHLVPRYEDDGLNTWPKSDYKEEDFEKVAGEIRSEL
ncbi:MAG: HIT family protein [Candidatus Bathyarchaeota archaeon]|nr:HIT family protein [Candidatus Bathyarchaeota archaeon]